MTFTLLAWYYQTERGELTMLSYFEVTGYKNFRETIFLDFNDVRDYQFNSNCVDNELIRKAIIYGKNAIGKSNFGSALLDIAQRPFRDTNNVGDDGDYDVSFLNTENQSGFAEFFYRFRFDEGQVEYVYRKSAPYTLLYEKIKVNDKIIVEYDREHPERSDTSGIEELSKTLILDFANVYSVFNYIVSNVPLKSEHPLKRTFEYIRRMRGLTQHTRGFAPFGRMPDVFADGGLEEFESFLCDAGIHTKLKLVEENDRVRLYFDTAPPLLFNQVASSGTKALLNFFPMFKFAERRNTSLLFLDEFDSFYHFELAETLIKMLDKLKDTQIIITSHNTNLLSNRIMRPDCYFIMTKDKLTSFANATTRELREGHNLEKLYMSGEFDE